MPWVNLAASAGSSLLQSFGGSSAERKQREAAEAAMRLKTAKFEEGKQLQQPWYNAGSEALSELQQRLPALTAGYDPTKLLTEPGYQFGLDEGQRALEQSLAARGMSSSGAALKRAARYGNDYATTKLGDAFNRDRLTRNDAIGTLMSLSDGGRQVGMNMSREGNVFAGSAADDMMGSANAGAANSLAQGNIWGDLLNYGASQFKKMPGGVDPQFNYDLGSDGNGGYYGNEGRRPIMKAEGGAVPMRAEPVVGTRAPKRQGGTGGAMSREAVLAALDAARMPAQAPVQPQPGLIPRVEVALDRATRTGLKDGGPVRAKSGGKADKVKTNLSGGEHVIDAELVAMLGDGNTEAGHEMLEEFKQLVRQFKRTAPAGRPAPALAGR